MKLKKGLDYFETLGGRKPKERRALGSYKVRMGEKRGRTYWFQHKKGRRGRNGKSPLSIAFGGRSRQKNFQWEIK